MKTRTNLQSSKEPRNNRKVKKHGKYVRLNAMHYQQVIQKAVVDTNGPVSCPILANAATFQVLVSRTSTHLPDPTAMPQTKPPWTSLENYFSEPSHGTKFRDSMQPHQATEPHLQAMLQNHVHWPRHRTKGIFSLFNDLLIRLFKDIKIHESFINRSKTSSAGSKRIT